MNNVAFITPPDAMFGFHLAGVPQHITDERHAEEALRNVMKETGTGLIIIDERLVREMGEDLLRELEQGWHGILLVLPSPEKPPPEVEDYAAMLIKRAIGYHVRLKL